MQIYQVLCVLICSYIVWVIADPDNSNLYMSSCSPSNGGVCSSSDYCRCASVVGGGGGNVCTQQMNCDYTQECSTNGTCPKENSFCASDSRCPGKNLCYSYVLTHPELCPPLATTTAGNN